MVSRVSPVVSPTDCYELYIGQLEAEGYVRASTLRSYRVHIGRFLRDADLPDDVHELNARHAIAWTNTLRKRGLKPGGIRSYQSSVWIWFAWLHREGYTPIDISRQVRRARKDEATVTRRTASDDTIAALVLVARARSEHAERNAALVLTLVATGARRMELAACHLEDYDRDAGCLSLARHTKSSTPRVVGVDAQARAALDRYIKLERGKEPGPLFLARMGRPLSANGMTCVLRSLAASASVDASAHDFRRACASRLLEAGASPWTVQQQLGHSSDWLTKQYAKAARERAALAEFHALDRGVRPMRRSS